jgi:hypothetical protein
MQLVAYGAQDIYLTGNPMITYFKVVYRRHTNFAMESIQQTFNGQAGFGQKVTALISRNGDLIHSMYLQATLPALDAVNDSATELQRWTDDVGHHLIQQVEVEIGGQLIDRQYGDWLEIWAQLTVPAGQQKGYREMIGQDPLYAFGIPSGLQSDTVAADAVGEGGPFRRSGRTIYVPLQFWFCRNVGLALPLIALQYHEVKVNLWFRRAEELYISAETATDSVQQALGTSLTNANLTASLWVDYIYLDTDERRRFAQVSHEYLIEQLQFTGEESSTQDKATVTLNFNHPVKELVWVCQHAEATANGVNQWSNYTNTPATLFSNNDLPTQDGLGDIVTDEPLSLAAVAGSDNVQAVTNQSMSCPSGSLNTVATAKLQLNGHDRFAERPGSYFNWVQCRQHHTNIPCSPGINVYSFALKPEDHQPSGTCNFSRIDNAKLVLKFNAGVVMTPPEDVNNGLEVSFEGYNHNIRVYAVNYNVLRIMSGMGGLAYSN